ncbi:type II toxin-antitoxin system Phd/YefM family antitoxin [Candidatus Kaiserbacteria bacterium]|nr:type II toxin-antitoxin system Phd/YefM family antitoxin [Candidatus Kaiserbacteria bacterium]
MAKVTIVPAREAKNRFGELLDAVQRQPVIITKKGRPVAKMIAFVDKKRFEEVEDQIWGERALKAEREGKWLGTDKSEAFLKKMRNARS